MRQLYSCALALFLGVGAFNTTQAQSVGTQNDVVRAVLNVYDDELREEPENYNVYFRRAHLYYGQNQYLQALSDIDNAIRYTPESDTDMISQEYALRANIYLMTDRPVDALPDLEKAYQADPTSYALLYQKANVEYELGKYTEAKDDYRRLQRYHNRSLESLIGLARVAVKENNFGLANEYADQAVNLYPASADAYIRRASVRTMLGNNTGAVDDLLLALSVEQNSGRAVSEIVKMSNHDYAAVISGLSKAISEASDVGMFYYIRAIIAQAHYHYSEAIKDFRTIISRNLYNYHGIHGSLAECYYAICEFQKALDEINYAIGSTTENAGYYITRSKIRLAMGNDIVAMESAMMAAEKDAGNVKAMIQKGLCAVKMRQFSSASDYFGEAILESPDNGWALVMRGWILANDINKPQDALNFYNRAIELASDEASTMKGFAMLAAGNTDDAISWGNLLLESPASDGSTEFICAALFSQAGEIDRAFELMVTSLNKGYANLYNWKFCDDANMNVGPLRTDPRFDSLIEKYPHLFQ